VRGYAQKSNTKSEILVEISLNIYLEIKIFKKLFSILYYNMNTNLLDLNDDILETIGGYVKIDNIERMEIDRMEKFKQDVFKYLDIQLEGYKKYKMSRHDKRIQLWQYFKAVVRLYFDNIENGNCNEIIKIFNEYLTLKKLTLNEEF
jgi:hypothetical protein